MYSCSTKLPGSLRRSRGNRAIVENRRRRFALPQTVYSVPGPARLAANFASKNNFSCRAATATPQRPCSRYWFLLLVILHILLFLAGYRDRERPPREAYVTLLYGDDFVNATSVLFYSLLRTGTTKEFVVLFASLNGSSLSLPARRQLESLGCLIKEIPLIQNPWAGFEPIRSVLAYQFTKLRVWQQTEYSKLVYLDSDMLVLKNIDLLFTYADLSAVDDYGFRAEPFGEFNGGLLVLEPSERKFRHMEAVIRYMSPSGSMEQSFLNRYYPQWIRLPYIFNAPANLYLRSPRMWNRQLRIIHYTFGKPWETAESSPHYLIQLRAVYQLWWDVFNEMWVALEEDERRARLLREAQPAD